MVKDFRFSLAVTSVEMESSEVICWKMFSLVTTSFFSKRMSASHSRLASSCSLAVLLHQSDLMWFKRSLMILGNLELAALVALVGGVAGFRWVQQRGDPPLRVSRG